MYRNILIATDGSALAQKALTHGLALAEKLGASVTVVTATEMWPLALDLAPEEIDAHQAIAEYERVAENSAGNILEVAAEEALIVGVPCEVRHFKDCHPSDGILEAARATQSDLIVLSTHGRRGLNRILLGSTASEVLTHSTIPVLVVR